MAAFAVRKTNGRGAQGAGRSPFLATPAVIPFPRCDGAAPGLAGGLAGSGPGGGGRKKICRPLSISKSAVRRSDAGPMRRAETKETDNACDGVREGDQGQ
jgi:hypothetical protein